MSYAAPRTDEPAREPRLIAVIDIGATSIRMAIAQLSPQGDAHLIEQLTQAVSLGEDTFSTGIIRRETIEDCVHVLETYRHKLNEYQIRASDRVKVVATSAVREASNSLAFQDRVYLATGFAIEPFDEAELHRATYLGIQPYMDELAGETATSLVYELGGGSTEVLALREGNVVFAQTFRLGALRLCVSSARYDSAIVSTREFLESQIDQALKRIKAPLAADPPKHLIALGGEIRLAAGELSQKPLGQKLLKLSLSKLQKFTESVLALPADRIAKKWHLDLSSAETLGPALLVHCMIAKEFQAEHVWVANANLRDGLILEMAKQRVWTEKIQEQIFRWALNLGRKYQFDEPHAVLVANLAQQLFDQLSPLHQMEPRYRPILYLAALLHEIGLFVDAGSYHKHSMYLINNSEFFGIGAKDVQLVALIARYHRRAMPQPDHEGYSMLDRDDRVAVTKLASLLRIARSLDSSRNQLIQNIRCEITGNRVIISVDTPADLTLEQMELQKDAMMFKDTFGRSVRLAVSDVPTS
jgi:exopolyphosphatase/guanosine-5'-triphosphate,3'-diphosphate pyrophosphatase